MTGCRSHIRVLAIGLALLFAYTAACPAAQPPLDEKTEEQLRALDNIVSEIKNPYGDADPAQRTSRGERLNQAFVALTGQAINPLVGVTVLGMYNYFRTDEIYREYLPLHDQPYVWIPFLVIILLMLFNSTICEAMPFLKVPLNALGDFVNKVGAVSLLPLIVKLFAESVAEPFAEEITWLHAALSSTAYAGEFAVAGAAWHAAGWLAAAVVGTVVYLVVWLTFNVIDVVILICPFPGVDAILKSFRLAVIAALTGIYQVSPTLALILACIIVLVSLFVAGWSFRLSVFGFIFSTDILFFRKRLIEPREARAFSTTGLAQAKRLPMRTLGTVSTDASGELLFTYRPWLVFGKKTLALGRAADFYCARGFASPLIVSAGRAGVSWLRLPPRYRKQENDIVSAFGLRETVDSAQPTSIRSWVRTIDN